MMRNTSATIYYHGVPIDVTGPAKAGLLIYQLGMEWFIFHIESGCRVCVGGRQKKDAKEKVQQLIDLGVDWKRPNAREIAQSNGYTEVELARKVFQIQTGIETDWT